MTLITYPVNPPSTVTRTFNFYQSVTLTMSRYADCRFNLCEAAQQIEENYRWIFGKHRTIESISDMFNHKDIRGFLKLSAINR
ncbi:hypothetical protein [Yersinia phage vB_YenM_P744]